MVFGERISRLLSLKIGDGLMLNKLLAMIALLAIIAVVPTTASAALFRTASLIDEGEAFANDRMFDSVGWLRGINDDDDGFVAGSAVLIDPYWVLTATHVTLWTGNDRSFSELSFSLSRSIFDDDPNFVDAGEWFTFPGYNSFPGRGNDIALVRLVDPIFDVIPAERYRGTDELGMRVNTVGYGNPGVWPNERPFDGVQRAGENIVDCFGCLAAVNNNYILAEFDDGLDRLRPALPLEWAGSNVDSGGGWFADVDGNMQLVGISAFVRGNSNTTGASRVSLYNDWIDETIATNSVPEPSSLVMFAFGSLGLLLRRGRKEA